MPVYEFLCRECNRVFNFLARTPEAAERRPKCPKCGGRRMSKRFSRFAARRGRPPAGPQGADREPTPQEEARMERTLADLARDMESADENDPRQVARAMRRLADAAGEGVDPQMEEMIRRIEGGEDPDKVEEDMAGAFGDEGGPAGGPPSHDEGLYDL